jgi:hypothetical protein
MKTSACLGTTAVAIAVLATIAGCSRAPFESTAGATVESSASSTTSNTAPAPIAPAVSRPITDFVEDAYYYSFATPSGQIQCRVDRGGDDHALACQTEGRMPAAADSVLCGFYPGVEHGHTNRFGFLSDRPQPCATIIQGVGFNSPHTLGYGQSVTAELSPGRTVTCTSAVEGLTCTPADGFGSRGFVLTVDSFTVI